VKKILIMCITDPAANPRPNRMIQWLKDSYEVMVLGRERIFDEGVESWALSDQAIRDSSSNAETASDQTTRGNMVATQSGSRLSQRLKIMMWWIRRIAKLVAGRYMSIVREIHGVQDALVEELKLRRFDLVINHDCVLMPLAFDIAGERAPILQDAREYFPRNFDDQLRWRLLYKPVYNHLCKQYLARCDKVITVSDGLAREYTREFGVNPEVVASLAEYHDLSPSKVDPDAIRVIYHGNAGESRRTELMVELMDFVDARFSLDLMLTRPSDPYVQKIMTLANERENVHVIPPVLMEEIIPFTNQYDVGLFLCPPANFNLKYTLPNKLFEYIQARLLVAIGPGIEMRKYVEEYDCGIVSPDFTPEMMAAELNKLDAERILYYKEQSHRAARKLHAGLNATRVNEIVSSLLSIQALT
jgi:glycosyltransferase involved in cell wall biosynthesis